MSLIPLPWRLLIYVVFIGLIWYIADRHRRGVDDTETQAELMTLQHSFDVRIKASDDALIAANARADAAGKGATTDQVAISAAYDKGMTDERSASKTRIDQFIASGKRVRIDATCTANAGSGSKLPGAATVASGSDAATPTDVELSPDALRRFGSAADNIIGGLIQKVIALQALAQSEHDRCNQGNVVAPVVPTSQVDDIAHKRSILGIALPARKN